MKWKGPEEDGITKSIIERFLGDDPYRCYLYFGLGLEEYTEPEKNLVYGSLGHVGLEHIIEKPYTIEEFEPEDWDQVFDAIKEYGHEEYPSAPPHYLYSLQEMLPLYDDSFKETYGRFVTELDFAVPYETASGRKVTLRGKVDGLQIRPSASNKIPAECNLSEREFKKIPEGFVPGTVLGEHKFKGKINPAQHRLEIPIDLQVGIYCYATGARRVVYDNIRIPDNQYSLPPRKSGQKWKGWIKDIYHTRAWGDFPVSKKRSLWINQQDIPITEENIETTFKYTVDPLIDWIWNWYEHCSQPGFDPDDPKFYGPYFWKKPARTFDAAKTMSFECNYYGLYTQQIGIDELVPIKGYYQELPE